MSTSRTIFRSSLILLSSLLFAEGAPGVVLSEDYGMISNGDVDGSRSRIEKAYGENPSDPATTLLYAKTMQDVPRALDLFKKIAADESLPDSIRGEAYFRLGCAAAMKGKFQKAGVYLKKAEQLSKDRSIDRSIVAARYITAVRDTTDSASMSSLRQQAADTTSFEGKIANYFLGLFYFAKKEYAVSLAHFTASVDASDTLWWTCASYAGAYSSAVSLGRSEEAAAILAHLKRVYPQYLEKNAVTKATSSAVTTHVRNNASAGTQSDTASVKKTAKVSVQKSTFSLQVGAFGSAQNAGALKTDLAKRYSPVSVVAALVQDKPIYRVRVGVFGSRETAQAFGDSALTKKGLQFRIVEDAPME
jgi:tetratricopeptide (TPR) repeat protein